MKIVIANWKMNVGTRESAALARGVLLALRGKKVLPELVLCPPFVALGEVRKIVARTHALLGAQDLFWEETGAFTGEISTRMLEEHGVTYVIIGHSERRAQLGETDAMVNKKLIAALAAGITPILCVGESKADRDAGKAEAVVGDQVRAALSGVRMRAKDRLLIAYEPIWAIGSGTPATPADAVAMHARIRAVARETGVKSVSVLYGGSVSPDNAYAFLRETEVDGVLVGGASVKLTEFGGILNAAIDAVEGEQEGAKK